MALLWPKHGPNMVPQISSSLILNDVPKDAPSQTSHCRVYPVAPFSRNRQNESLFQPKMVLTWCLILIKAPRDTPSTILHCWMNPVAPFSINVQNMTLLQPKHCPHMVLQIGASWILINVSRDAWSLASIFKDIFNFVTESLCHSLSHSVME